MKKTTKLLGIILTLVMVLSMTTVSANEGTEAREEVNDFNYDFLINEDATTVQKEELKAILDQLVELERQLDQLWEQVEVSEAFIGEEALDLYWDEIDVEEEFTIEMLLEEVKEDADPDLVEQAKVLFEEAMAAEEVEDYDVADEKWDALFELDIWAYWEEFDEDDYEEFTVEMLLEEVKEGADPALVEQAKVLFEEAMAAEEAEDYDTADDKWEALFELDIWEEFEEYDYDDYEVDDEDVSDDAEL